MDEWDAADRRERPDQRLREDALDHAAYYAWLNGVFRSHASFALPDIVAAAFVRIVTNPRIFANPNPWTGRWPILRIFNHAPNAYGCAPAIAIGRSLPASARADARAI